MSDTLSTDLKVVLDSIHFRVDSDDELEVDIDNGDCFATRWLKRSEAEQLLEMLTRWLR